MKDMPTASTIVPTTSPMTAGHAAMTPMPMAEKTSAIDPARRPPSRSGSRAPTMRTTRISTP